jgi:HPr kinase/phosphorylase
MTDTVVFHASCIRLGSAGAVFGAPPEVGVLLMGPSGAGKSDLALQLIFHGAELVADDRTELYVAHGQLLARAVKRGAGLLEVRGVGIVQLASVESVRIALAVSLEPGPRLPEHRPFLLPDGGLPAFVPPPWIAVENSPSAAAKVALAVAAYELGLHKDDVDRI